MVSRPSDKENLEPSKITSRRELLMAAGMGSFTVLAGCLGGDAGDGTESPGDQDTEMGTTEAPPKEPVDKTFAISSFQTADPRQMQYNPLSTAPMAPETHARLGWERSHPDFESFVEPAIATGFDVEDEDKFVLSLRDDSAWWNGDVIDAEDVKTTLVLNSVLDAVLRNTVESFEITGDFELTFNLSNPLNPDIFAETVMLRDVRFPTHEWGDLADRAEDLIADDDDLKQIRSDMISKKLPDPVGNNLFKPLPDQHTGRLYVSEIHDGHYLSELWEGVEEWHFIIEENRIEPFLAGEADLTTTNIPEDVTPPEGTSFHIASNFASGGLGFNRRQDLFANDSTGWRVRKAIAYLIDRERVASNMGDPKEWPVAPYQVGLTHSFNTVFGGDGFVDDNLEHYNPVDEGRAETLLQDAGLTKDGGEWYTPDAEKWRPVIISHGFPGWVRASQTIVSILNDAGIGAEYRQVEWGVINSVIEEGDYSFHFHWSTRGVTAFQGWQETLTGQRLNSPGLPEDGVFEVPPIGEPEGSPESVNVFDLLDELQQTTDSDRITELNQEIGWIWNQALPAVEVSPRQQIVPIRTDRWSLCSEDQSGHGVRSPQYVGCLTPRYE